MAKKQAAEGGKVDGGKKAQKVLEAARKHQDVLLAAGLHTAVIEKLERALKGIGDAGKEPNAAIQVLVKDIRGEVAEYHTAIKKEFPANASFQAIFKAQEPMPTAPGEVLALGREIAKVAPDFSANLIRYAINAASVKHLSYLCDQLEKELGGADPAKEAKEAEEQILEVARRAFEGKPELAEFAK